MVYGNPVKNPYRAPEVSGASASGGIAWDVEIWALKNKKEDEQPTTNIQVSTFNVKYIS